MPMGQLVVGLAVGVHEEGGSEDSGTTGSGPCCVSEDGDAHRTTGSGPYCVSEDGDAEDSGTTGGGTGLCGERRQSRGAIVAEQ